MRRVFLLFLILTVFASESYAESLSTQNINGTSFTLLSNTNQCLAECEAIIEWDLTKGIASNVQLPGEQTSQFGFELIKADIQTPGLLDFGVEVWEQDKGKWQKVSDSFYGFKAMQGKIYRLRVWGKKKAGLEANSVDWVPTFFGQTIGEWSWFDGDWKARQKITLRTSSILTGDITEDYVILFDVNSNQTDFWAKVQADGGDVRFVSADDLIEYDYYFERFEDANQSMVAWVEITDTFTTATDLILNMYYSNPDAEDSQSFKRDVYPNHYIVAYDFNFITGTTEFDVVDTNNLTLANGPPPVTDGKINGAISFNSLDTATVAAPGKLFDFGFDELTVMMWVAQKVTWDVTATQNPTMILKNMGAPDTFSLQWRDDGALRWQARTAGVLHFFDSAKVSWAENEWFNIAATFSDSNNAMILYANASIADGGIKSEAMAPMGADNSADFTFGSNFFDANMDRFVAFNKVLTSEEILLLYTAENFALQEFGATVTAAIMDLNIVSIDGEAFSLIDSPVFAFGLDGNISVEFNVFDSNNNRLTIDLNFGAPLQGEGSVIVKDLNLTSDICPDQDWDDVPSVCSFSAFDFSASPDGNFAIVGVLDNGLFTDFNADGNFMVITDVNLIVLVPINEETGVVIDTSTSAFIVRINANGVLSVFDNQLDLNGFLIPLGTSFILVEVDTNTPALFNSRVYSFLFDSAQVSEILQPFLPPVAASILTTVKTLQFENLKPIPGVRIRVFKDLAGGRTLIHDSVTDGKGETTIPFIVADLYEIDVLVDGVLIFTEPYIATATTNEHFIFISSTGEVVVPSEIPTPSVFFTPEQSHFSTVDVNLGVVVSTDLANISAIHFFISNADFNIWDGGLDSAAPADGNTYSININDINPLLLDTNFPFTSTVIVFLNDGSSFAFYASYSLRPGSDEVLNLLMFDMRDEFGCNTSNLAIRCDGLMFLAFFIILFVLCAFAAGARGFVGGAGLSLIGLILMLFFVVIAWIPMWLGLVMIFAAVGVILTRTRFIGA